MWDDAGYFWVAGQRFIAEAGDWMIRQFLTDALKIFFRIRIFQLLPIGKGHSADHFFFCRSLILALNAKVKRRQVRLIIAGDRVAPKAVAVVFCFYHISVVLYPTAFNFTAVAAAVAGHGTEVLEDTLPHLIHHYLKLHLELRRIQLRWSSRMPGMPEFIACPSKVHADMANGSQRLILFRWEGEEKPRLIGRGGAHNIFSFVVIHEITTPFLVCTTNTTTLVRSLPRIYRFFA